MRGSLTITVENDILTGSDSDYSNGIAATWTSGDVKHLGIDDPVAKWANFWSWLPGIDARANPTYVAWTLAQEIHTPEDISAANPSAGASPYAGLLYVDSLLYSVSHAWSHSWHMRGGIVGPDSLADKTQIQFHELIGAIRPQGWRTQLPNEPIFNIGYSGAYRWIEYEKGSSASLRVSPLLNLELGNYATALGLGALVEYGWYLPDALSVSSIGRGLNSAMIIGSKPTDQWSASLFVSAVGYGVGHYLPLDGTLFERSPSAERGAIAVQGMAGLSIRSGRFSASFAVSLLTDFGGQRSSAIDYGILSIAWHL